MKISYYIKMLMMLYASVKLLLLVWVNLGLVGLIMMLWIVEMIYQLKRIYLRVYLVLLLNLILIVKNWLVIAKTLLKIKAKYNWVKITTKRLPLVYKILFKELKGIVLNQKISIYHLSILNLKIHKIKL